MTRDPLVQHILDCTEMTYPALAKALGVTLQGLHWKLRHPRAFSLVDLAKVATASGLPLSVLLTEPAMDGAMMVGCWRMFQHDPLALDYILGAFVRDKQLLHEIGRYAQSLMPRERSKRDRFRRRSPPPALRVEHASGDGE